MGGSLHPRMGEICSEHDGSFPWQVVMGGATIRQERARSALVFLKRSERMFFVQMEKIRALMTGRLDLSLDRERRERKLRGTTHKLTPDARCAGVIGVVEKA